jgi:hypothetical protein
MSPATETASPAMSAPAAPAATPLPPLMTRDQLHAYLVAWGYPIGASTFEKICAPAIGEGPPVDRYWGRRPLYDPAAGLAWAEARCKKVKTRVA